jgi:hypothetical protein
MLVQALYRVYFGPMLQLHCLSEIVSANHCLRDTPTAPPPPPLGVMAYPVTCSRGPAKLSVHSYTQCSLFSGRLWDSGVFRLLL